MPEMVSAQERGIISMFQRRGGDEAARRYPNLYDLGRIMIRQGMRPDEVMGLEQANIDLEKGTLFIPRASPGRLGVRSTRPQTARLPLSCGAGSTGSGGSSPARRRARILRS